MPGSPSSSRRVPTSSASPLSRYSLTATTAAFLNALMLWLGPSGSSGREQQCCSEDSMVSVGTPEGVSYKVTRVDSVQEPHVMSLPQLSSPSLVHTWSCSEAVVQPPTLLCQRNQRCKAITGMRHVERRVAQLVDHTLKPFDQLQFTHTTTAAQCMQEGDHCRLLRWVGHGTMQRLMGCRKNVSRDQTTKKQTEVKRGQKQQSVAVCGCKQAQYQQKLPNSKNYPNSKTP